MNIPAIQNASGMQDPLEQLRDIHLPLEISQWPLAVGWNILILLFIALTITALFFIYRYWSESRYKREALNELALIQQAFQKNTSDYQSTAQALSNLLKRIALTLYPRSNIAPLHGKPWLTLLDQMSASHFFTEHEGQILGDTLFKKIPGANDEQFTVYQHRLQTSLDFTEHFIKQLKIKWVFKND